MIIGSDLLQDMSKDISLITGDRCFKVNRFKLNTARSETAAKREFMRRSRMDLTAYMNEFEDEPSDAMLRTKDAYIENLLLVSRKHISNSLYIILEFANIDSTHHQEPSQIIISCHSETAL